MSASMVRGAIERRNKTPVKFNSLYPSKPVAFSAMDHPTAEDVGKFFDGDKISIDDTSITRMCELFTISPVITKGMRKSGYALSLLIEDGLSLMSGPKNFLGLQHGLDLCERYNSRVAYSHFSRSNRIWFYGLYVQGEHGDDYYPVIMWKSKTKSWQVQMVPVCDYHSSMDCIACARL